MAVDIVIVFAIIAVALFLAEWVQSSVFNENSNTF